MISYICDDSFEGLLTAIYYAYKNPAHSEILSGKTFQLSLTQNFISIETDFSIYSKMESFISSHCGVDCLMIIYKAYLSEEPKIAEKIHRFFRIAIKKREETLFMHVHPSVLPVLNAQKKVSRESHRMLGFIRFKKIDTDLLYAGYTPTSNVTPLVAPHFTDRMNSFNWIIHDLTRDIYAIYNKKDCIIGSFLSPSLPSLTDIDADYKVLWQTYSEYATIKERTNLKLQMSHMPKKYWNFLIEKKV